MVINTSSDIQNAIEINLFFARIMKEHAYFLAAVFQAMNRIVANRFKSFQNNFESILAQALNLSGGKVSPAVLSSNELVTIYTLDAENRSVFFTNIPINTEITLMERQLTPSASPSFDNSAVLMIKNLNANAAKEAKNFADYQQLILNDISVCNTQFFPSFVRHYINEANVYQFLIGGENDSADPKSIMNFWNASLGEHAAFIPSQVDISEKDVIGTSNQFRQSYEYLTANGMLPSADPGRLANESMYYTDRFRDFLNTNMMDALSCDLLTIALPLMIDHILRESNYYLRLLNTYRQQE